MKVFLTGCTGFLGRHIIDTLAKKGAQMIVLKRKTSRIDHLRSYDITFVEGNIREREVLEKAMQGVDVVIHAVSTKVGGYEDFHEEVFVSTQHLLELSRKQNIKRFVYISSIDVYDHAPAKNGSRIDERWPLDANPSNPYGKSKIDAEILIQEHHSRHNVPTVIVRPGCIYGIGANYWYPARLGFTAGSMRYALLGGGRTLVPLSWAPSVADVVWRSIENDAAVGQAYNVLEETDLTRIGFLRLVRKHLYPELKVIRLRQIIARPLAFAMRTALKIIGKAAPTRIHPSYMRLFDLSVTYDSRKAKEELGWVPVADVEESIVEMLDWFRERKDRPRSQMLIPELPVRVSGDRTLRVGLVGCGAFADTHMAVLKGIRQAEVAGACDPNPDARKRVEENHGLSRTYEDLSSMLEKEKLDVVHVLSPTQTHARAAIEAVEGGCHVLVEKPFAVNAEEARRMIAAAKERGVSLCAEHTPLYNPGMIEARRMIQDGLLGEIVQVEGWFGTSFSSNPGAPFLRYQAKDSWFFGLPGRLFQDFIPHPISAMLDVMGEIQTVDVESRYNRFMPHMSADELRIFLGNDTTLGTLSLSFGATPRHITLNIYGTEGTAKVDMLVGTALLYKDVGMLPKVLSRSLLARRHGKQLRRAGGRNMRGMLTGKQLQMSGHDPIIRLFYKSLLEGTPLPVSHENALRSMEVMDRIWEQLDLG